MPDITAIQWADTTVNPIMGCGGCELFPQPDKVLGAIDTAVAATGGSINSRTIYRGLINEAYGKISHPKPGHKNAVNTTNLWQLRYRFLDLVQSDYGGEAKAAAEKAISQSITCYAAVLHMNHGLNLLKPDWDGNKGYAPIFEALTKFEGRALETANLKDLLGLTPHPKAPWKARLPRLIFVSDMGDALTRKSDFPFLKSDLMPAIQSPKGKQHLWLWLTKRPGLMAEFADEIGGLPKNVCAMTTLTGADPESLQRLADLKKVKAHIRGLSIEPLWEPLPPSKLNLKGIHWCIVGGESGSGLEFTRPFALELAEELRDHCRKEGVAFFLKQLGRNPTRNENVIRLKNGHGGEWNEWPDEALKIREFPQAFHNYRKNEMIEKDELRPIKEPKKKKKPLFDVTPQHQADFKRLDKVVRKGYEAFIECGEALIEIQENKLWRAGNWPTWEDYCRQVAGLSKSYASRIMKTSRLAADLCKKLPIGNSVTPISESQVRPLLQLPGLDQQEQAWVAAVKKAEGKQPTAAVVQEMVFEILHPEGPTEPSPSRSQRRSDVVSRLREVVAQRKSWAQVERLMEELEELL